MTDNLMTAWQHDRRTTALWLAGGAEWWLCGSVGVCDMSKHDVWQWHDNYGSMTIMAAYDNYERYDDELNPPIPLFQPLPFVSTHNTHMQYGWRMSAQQTHVIRAHTRVRTHALICRAACRHSFFGKTYKGKTFLSVHFFTSFFTVL
jgi:hypothetical protein